MCTIMMECDVFHCETFPLLYAYHYNSVWLDQTTIIASVYSYLSH